MASTSEVGNNKNVANFTTLAQILEEMGALYNPSNTNITLVKFQPIKITLSSAMGSINEKKPTYTNAVADRELKMNDQIKRTSRVLNAFKSLNVGEKDKQNAAALVKKIRGDNKPKKVNPATADAATISSSQASFDNRIANLDILIAFISSHPEYNPNEEDITIAELISYNEELKMLTQTVNAAGHSLITARKQRNDILYHGPNNIIDMVREVKAYLKSLGDAGKPYYKAVVRLQFKEVS
jgi:hypothetical protein